MSAPVPARLASVIAGALRCEAAALGPETTQRSLPAWTSVSHLMLVHDLERTYAIRLTTAEILGIDSVGDIVRILKERGIEP